jgi:hypothetical protein
VARVSTLRLWEETSGESLKILYFHVVFCHCLIGIPIGLHNLQLALFLCEMYCITHFDNILQDVNMLYPLPGIVFLLVFL